MCRSFSYRFLLVSLVCFAGCAGTGGGAGSTMPIAATGAVPVLSTVEKGASVATTPAPTIMTTSTASTISKTRAITVALVSPIPTMAATSADAFVSSMGVDVDLVTPKESAQPLIDRTFAGLGVRHTRISILEPNATYEANVKAFFAANSAVHAYGLTSCPPKLGPNASSDLTAADITGFQSRTGTHLDRIEGVNEPNGTSDSNWAADTHSCFAPFVGKVDGVPLVAPALITQYQGTGQEALGAVSGAAMGNIHRYFAGRNPGTAGWGGDDKCGAYGALQWSICWAKVTAPGMPIVVTETGWNSDSEVDLATQAKYVERVFFVNAQAGIAATSLYTFESYSGGDGYGGDGIVNTDFSAKPAYTAVANITKLLSDSGSSYAPSPLQISVSPAPVSAFDAGIHAMLLGKRNGSYYLALWQEVQSANPNKRGDDTVPATVDVKLTLASLRTATLYAWQDNGSAPTTALGMGLAFTIPVTDRLSIVQLQ